MSDEHSRDIRAAIRFEPKEEIDLSTLAWWVAVLIKSEPVVEDGEGRFVIGVDEETVLERDEAPSNTEGDLECAFRLVLAENIENSTVIAVAQLMKDVWGCQINSPAPLVDIMWKRVGP